MHYRVLIFQPLPICRNLRITMTGRMSPTKSSSTFTTTTVDRNVPRLKPKLKANILFLPLGSAATNTILLMTSPNTKLLFAYGMIWWQRINHHMPQLQAGMHTARTYSAIFMACWSFTNSLTPHPSQVSWCICHFLIPLIPHPTWVSQILNIPMLLHLEPFHWKRLKVPSSLNQWSFNWRRSPHWKRWKFLLIQRRFTNQRRWQSLAQKTFPDQRRWQSLYLRRFIAICLCFYCQFQNFYFHLQLLSPLLFQIDQDKTRKKT